MRSQVAENPRMKLAEQGRDGQLQARLRGRKHGLEPLGEADVAHDERLPLQTQGGAGHRRVASDRRIVWRHATAWELEAESGPRPWLALDLQVGAVQVEDLGHECEAEARPSRRSGVRIASAEEPFPDVGQLIGWYPGSVVLNGDDRVPAFADRGHTDDAPRRRVFRCVREQVFD